MRWRSISRPASSSTMRHSPTSSSTAPRITRILALYNALAGPSRMPPDWALGPIWWRDDSHEDLRSSERRRLANAQEVVLNDARELQKRRIPASAMWLDRPYARPDRGFGWGGMKNGRLQFGAGFPDPAKMIDTPARGWPQAHALDRKSERQPDGRGGKGLGYLLSTERAVDMRNAGAYVWFQDKLDTFLDARRARIQDRPRRGERGPGVPAKLQRGAVSQDGGRGTSATTTARTTSCLRETSTTRAASTPRCGTATPTAGRAFGNPSGRRLRCALMNFPMWGSDTGGYGETTAELFARWSQFAAYTPMMEILIGPGRTPWLDFPQERVRHRRRTGADEARPDPVSALATVHCDQDRYAGDETARARLPEDPAVGDLSDEYLYGSELLVAPVLEKGARERDVYLPEGQWLDYQHEGTRSIPADDDFASRRRSPAFPCSSEKARSSREEMS